ncbi:ankyrin repeat-containing domain protein [Dendryphion nanum]|uniref:Ankyrin repeat-containing domain protein n=1 Tax=Dendryphion nanum TaxID=256645 RepID=A0A9P9IU23_9PLEO|nr:ankyrin repeat-containing domain protein [Dendryphion nanum]
MNILDLPLELFQAILAKSIVVRSWERETFAEQIIETIFAFKLLDAFFSDSQILAKAQGGVPPFAAAYLESRVLNEPESGKPVLVGLRHIAKILCTDNESQAPDQGEIDDCVSFLCSVAATNRTLDHYWDDDPLQRRLHYFFLDNFEEEDFAQELFVAAIVTNNTQILRNLPSSTWRTRPPSDMFGECDDIVGEFANENTMVELIKDLDNHGNSDWRYWIHPAAAADRVEIVKFLFNYTLWDFDDQDWTQNGSKYILGALGTPKRETAEYIMERRDSLFPTKLDIDDHFIMGDILRLCAEKGWFEVAKYLLEKGATFKRKHNTDNYGPLIRACRVGSLDLVKLLLRASPSRLGALGTAAKCNHKDIMRYLLESEQSIEYEFCRAVIGGNMGTIRLLLDHGVDLTSTPPNATHPLVSAIRLENEELFLLLLEHGACLDESYQGTTVIEECIAIAKRDGLESWLEIFTDACLNIDAGS